MRPSLAVLAALLLGLVWPVGNLAAAPTPSAALAGSSVRGVYVRPPRNAGAGDRPVQVLLALHGMGGNGEDFARGLADQADRYGWLIVAPTIDYGDWRDPAQVAREDPVLIRALSDYLDGVGARSGLRVRREVLVLGHSRGAQLAHRFAEFRPDRVLAVAALSAGTYTLPGPVGGTLSFPYGVRDLATYTGRAFDAQAFDRVPFYVGVGGEDTNPGDLPRQWDRYEGTTRLQRAQVFQEAMRQLGASAVLRVFGGAQHDLTPEMRSAACAFLHGASGHAGAVQSAGMLGRSALPL